jgi:uncharacterized lipoprotein YmbA
MTSPLRAAWVAAMCICSGCWSSPSTAYYTLAAVSGTVHPASLGTIEVRRPGLAGYLDRAEILGPWDGHRLQLTPRACWGEPVVSMIGRVLAEDLGERLHGTVVFSAASDLSIQASSVVELTISKFDLDRDGNVRLAALSYVRGGGREATHAHALQARPAATTPDALAAAMSALLGQLADELATALIGTSDERASREAPHYSQ